MTNQEVDQLKLFSEYDQKTLAELWHYKSYDAIRRGIVTPANSNIIILFVTEKKAEYATQYVDRLQGNILYMSGETRHINDERLATNLNVEKDTIYLFYRQMHHTPFIYYGEVKLTKYIENQDKPSQFEFLVKSIKKDDKMKFFGFKISNPSSKDLVNDVKLGKDNITIDQLNQLENDLKVGDFVFVTLGGDKVTWKKGLIGLASITKAPFDKGYDENNPRNFKLGIKMELVLPGVIKRNEFIPYLDAYDAAGIGPNTKGEQNQAIKALTQKQSVSILRAMVDREPSLQEKIEEIFGSYFAEKIFGKLPILVLNSLSFGEKAPENILENSSQKSFVHTDGDNILLYGVPGCGKSNIIKEKYCNDERYMERLVFHPDYTYSDFVGQVIPKVDSSTNQIKYEFSEGPFIRILKKAYSDPTHKYYLVIEEINRGNAPAIFGDVFQLLDRNENGESCYGITNADIAAKVYGNIEKMVKLPGNLTIIATMNTSDQSVFTLDTAFKRRWKMTMIKNDILHSKYAKTLILGEPVTWAQFATAVNKKIVEEDSDALGNEDKCLGAYFIKEEDLKLIDGNYNPAFAEKVIMYLWNDVFKYNKETIFSDKYKTLEDVIDAFEQKKFKVFNLSFDVVLEESEENAE